MQRYQCQFLDCCVTLEALLPHYGVAGHVFRLQVNGRGGYACYQDMPADALLSLADAIYRMAGQAPIILQRPEPPKPLEPLGYVGDVKVETGYTDEPDSAEVAEIKRRMQGG